MNKHTDKNEQRIGVHKRRILTSECCEQKVETESGGILIQIQFTTSEYNNNQKFCFLLYYLIQRTLIWRCPKTLACLELYWMNAVERLQND